MTRPALEQDHPAFKRTTTRREMRACCKECDFVATVKRPRDTRGAAWALFAKARLGAIMQRHTESAHG